MKRILITGGTGFIGQHLVHALVARGDEVTVLSRRPEEVTARLGANVRAAQWEPSRRGERVVQQAWAAQVGAQQAIVHLAGHQAAGIRYTADSKRRIYESRIESTLQLVEAIAEASPRPSVLVCASGVGFYGGHMDATAFDERAPVGSDFLAKVCLDWEGAAQRASEYGVRVVNTRFGIVLGRGGGALETMAKPFKMFAGGPIGSGQQVVSWVHIEDAVRVLLQAIDDDALSGPVNVTTPNAVTNEELSRTIGSVLKRPSWMRVPKAALRAAFGEGAEPLLTGQRAVPARLRQIGFEWRYPELRPALEEALSRS